jgi:AcrR family transcriptional regulator
MDPTDAPRQAILDAALDLAEHRGWDALHLYDVAQAMGLTLADIAAHFDDKDALAEAWFDRADAALLAVARTPGWPQVAPRERVRAAILAWLDALAPHRSITATMLAYKVQPEHVHLQVRGVMRVSRTVQWIREVALLPQTGWRRELLEAGLTSMFLATVACWVADGSPDMHRTRALLDRLLGAAEWTAQRLGDA